MNLKKIGFAITLLLILGQAYAGYQRFQVVNLTAATKNDPNNGLQFYDFKSRCTDDTERQFARASYPFNVPVDIIIDRNTSCKPNWRWYFSMRVRTHSGENIGYFGWYKNRCGGNSFAWEDAPGHHIQAADGGNGLIVLYVY